MITLIDTAMPTGKRFKDLSGQKIGKWKIISYAGRTNGGKNLFWNCECECGEKNIIYAASLKGRSNPGCLKCRFVHRREKPEYKTWQRMIQRCGSNDPKEFVNYRGRGIKVCARWRGRQGFVNFLADIGARPSPKHSIDRFPNNAGNYEPGNCRWATAKQQGRNTRRNRFIEIDGISKCVSEWAEISGISRCLISLRLSWKWEKKEAVFFPPDHNSGRKSRKHRQTIADQNMQKWILSPPDKK